MGKMKTGIVTTEIIVKENKIGIMRVGNVNYISLTDLAKYANPKDPSGVIRNWMSNKNSFDYYSLWKKLIMKILIPWNPTELKLMKFHIIDLL